MSRAKKKTTIVLLSVLTAIFVFVSVLTVNPTLKSVAAGAETDVTKIATATPSPSGYGTKSANGVVYDAGSTYTGENGSKTVNWGTQTVNTINGVFKGDLAIEYSLADLLKYGSSSEARTGEGVTQSDMARNSFLRNTYSYYQAALTFRIKPVDTAYANTYIDVYVVISPNDYLILLRIG